MEEISSMNVTFGSFLSDVWGNVNSNTMLFIIKEISIIIVSLTLIVF